VERQLEWEPAVDERRIGVSVLDGVVTLTGEVMSITMAAKASEQARIVPGVKSVKNELTVRQAGK